MFYSEYGSDPDTDPKLDRLDSPAPSGPGVWQVGRGRGRKQDTAISMETDTGFEEVLDPGHQKLPGEPLKVRSSLLHLPSPMTSAANQLIGEVVQSRRRPLLGPSPG